MRRAATERDLRSSQLPPATAPASGFQVLDRSNFLVPSPPRVGPVRLTRSARPQDDTAAFPCALPPTSRPRPNALSTLLRTGFPARTGSARRCTQTHVATGRVVQADARRAQPAVGHRVERRVWVDSCELRPQPGPVARKGPLPTPPIRAASDAEVLMPVGSRLFAVGRHVRSAACTAVPGGCIRRRHVDAICRRHLRHVPLHVGVIAILLGSPSLTGCGWLSLLCIGALVRTPYVLIATAPETDVRVSLALA